MMTETIDKTQWVPKGETLFPQERLAKGGIIHTNGRYSVEFALTIDFLIASGLIDQDGHNAALDLISLREVALSPVGYSIMRYSSEWLGRTVSDECPMTLYGRIMAGFKPFELNILQVACFDPKDSRKWPWLRQCHTSVRNTFERLASNYKSVMIENEERTVAPRI